jgi:Flp pilus assembly protein TadG
MKHLRKPRNERGAALILVALSLVATMTVAGLVVDGGNAFSQRRQMQNAADAAALAGARALDRYQAIGSTLSRTTVWSAVVNRAVSDGAAAGLVTCRLVDETLADLGACPVENSTTINPNAAGVKATVAQTSNTSLMRVVGISDFTARAGATAQIEALRSGKSPFMICAVGNNDPRAINDGQTVPILDTQNNINPAAIYNAALGQTTIFKMQDPQSPTCGQGNSFKDLTDGNDHPIPGDWPIPTGDLGNNISQSIISGPDACTATYDNCVMAVPLCYAPSNSVTGDPIANASPPRLYCVRYAAFLLVNTGGASRIGGKLLGDVVATGGHGGGKAQPGEVRIIKLSE